MLKLWKVEFVRWCLYFESETVYTLHKKMSEDNELNYIISILIYASPVSPETPQNQLPKGENGEKWFLVLQERRLDYRVLQTAKVL